MIRNHRFGGLALACLVATAALLAPFASAQNDTGPDVDVDVGDGDGGAEESREPSGWWASGPFLLVVGILFVVAIALIVALAGRR